MRLRTPPRPLTPEENAERNRKRNIERIMNPPKPSLWDRIAGVAWEVEEWWCRHVSQRELYRRLDGLRVVMRPHPATTDAPERLRADVLYPEWPDRYPGGAVVTNGSFCEGHANWTELIVRYHLDGQQWPKEEIRRTSRHIPLRLHLLNARTCAAARVGL